MRPICDTDLRSCCEDLSRRCSGLCMRCKQAGKLTQIFCKAYQRKLCVQVDSQIHSVMPDVSRSRHQMAAGWMSQQVQMRLHCSWGLQQSRRQLAS